MASAQLINLGKAIRARREELGLARDKVAWGMDVASKTFERWEKGQTATAHANLGAIAEALDTTPETLMAAAAAFGHTPTDESRDVTRGDLMTMLEEIRAQQVEMLQHYADLEQRLEDQHKPPPPVARPRKAGES